MSIESLMERLRNLPDDCGATDRPGESPTPAEFLDANEDEPTWKGPPREGKALVVFAHGLGMVLAHDGGEALLDVIGDYSVAGELTTEEMDVDPPADGVWLAQLKLVDDGPADGPYGGREVAVQMGQFRTPTREEWEAHLEGLWPWPESGEPES